MPLLNETYVRCNCGNPLFSMIPIGTIPKIAISVGSDDQPIMMEDITYQYICTECGIPFTRKELMQLAKKG